MTSKRTETGTKIRLLFLIAITSFASSFEFTFHRPMREMIAYTPSVVDMLIREEKKEDSRVAIAAKMIVFDKDGTLGDDRASLKRWADHMTDKLVKEMQQMDNSEEQIIGAVARFHSVLGWDAGRDNVVPSAPLAAGTWEEQIVNSANIFQDLGIQDPVAKASTWHDKLGDLHGNDSPVIADLRGLILDMKSRGLKVAICTSDDRLSTDASIMNWKLKDLIDYSICGNEVRHSKPSAEPLNILCSWANVKPSECIVVGDTTSDTGMAKAAGAGYMVGVLTGSGTSEQLLADGAHLVLPNVGFLPQLLDAIGVVVAATRSPIGKIKSQAAVEELLVDAAASSSILRV